MRRLQGRAALDFAREGVDPSVELPEPSGVARAVDARDARFGGCPRVRCMSFREWATTAVGRAAAVGSQPSDTPDERLRKSALVLSSLLITVLSFIWVGTYAALGLWRSALIPLAYQVASLIGLVFFARTKRYGAYRASQVAMMLLLPFLLQWSLGGFVESGAVALWAFVAPLGALVFYGPRAGDRLVRSVPRASSPSPPPSTASSPSPAEDIPTWVVVAFFALNIFGPSITTFALLEHFVRSRDRAHRLLAAEQERSETLLSQHLPARRSPSG